MATSASAPVHRPERPLTEARKAEPLHKAAVTIGAARPAWTALGWLRRGTFLPPLPVLAARPTVPEGVLRDVWVNVRVRVDTAGKVTAAKPEGSTSNAELAEAAVAAAREWSFPLAHTAGRWSLR